MPIQPPFHKGFDNITNVQRGASFGQFTIDKVVRTRRFSPHVANDSQSTYKYTVIDYRWMHICSMVYRWCIVSDTYSPILYLLCISKSLYLLLVSHKLHRIPPLYPVYSTGWMNQQNQGEVWPRSSVPTWHHATWRSWVISCIWVPRRARSMPRWPSTHQPPPSTKPLQKKTSFFSLLLCLLHFKYVLNRIWKDNDLICRRAKYQPDL